MTKINLGPAFFHSDPNKIIWHLVATYADYSLLNCPYVPSIQLIELPLPLGGGSSKIVCI